MIRNRLATLQTALLILLILLPLSQATAQIVLSNLIVEFLPGKEPRQDVEVWNNSPERTYVAVERVEIVNPGTSREERREEPDPQKLGILVSPARMILEPGQRKLVRMAVVVPAGDLERVYRLTVKPVVGATSSDESGLKILVGYEVLVLVRPSLPQANIVYARSGDTGTFRNDGSVSVELIHGRECDAAGKSCTELSGKRLYPGAQWSVMLKSGRQPEYTLKSPGQALRKVF